MKSHLFAFTLACAAAAPLAAQDVTPDVIFGSGNANGSFTVDRQNGVELGLRTKLRFDATGQPQNVFSSNGDGTYTWNVGVAPTQAPPTPIWAFEWTANSDYDGSTGDDLDDLTYELGLDFDPSSGTNYLAFDQITPTVAVDYWDHALGNNSTPNGGGTVAIDALDYATLIGANNVAQNSWRMNWFEDPGTYDFDPTVPGQYEFYLAAFDGGAEVARTAMTVFVVDGTSLTLEGDACQQDQDPVTAGVQVAYELWLRNPDDLDVTGWQAFLEYNPGAMTYVGATSSYSAGPFTSHFQGIASAMVASGDLRLDGNTFPATTGATGDALLATLLFTVTECDLNTVDFDLLQAFPSEVSFLGSALTTALVDSSAVVGDDTPPVLAGTPTNITQPADAGSCTQAVVAWTDPTATDICDTSPVVVCSPPSGSIFPVGITTVTCTATDECGNESTSSFTVEITATNAVDVVVHLTGSMPTTRCIHFVTDSCTTVADVNLTFVGTAPAVATATIEVPCGVWTTLSAKDEQHTHWDNTTLSVVGANYLAATTLVLDGGDTENDADIDINDVTLLLAQFGNLASAGGCPWDGTRDADFDNDGAVGSSDYGFLVAGWLTTSGNTCSLPYMAVRPTPQRRVAVHNPLTARVDFNRDGWVDYCDVEMLEGAKGLSGELSKLMRP